jgi:hypothetical protein
MEQPELLRHVCSLLDQLGVRYMVTGSQATIAYGEPRFTNDIDIVADLDTTTLDAFCGGFPEDEYYLSRMAAREAVERRSMFNIIHPTSGLKIDVIVPAASGYDQSRLDRAIRMPVSKEFDAKFTTPEDIILKKLEWHEMGGGERHLQDIAGILKVMGDRLDYHYIKEVAQKLGVLAGWLQLMERTRRKPQA